MCALFQELPAIVACQATLAVYLIVAWLAARGPKDIGWR